MYACKGNGSEIARMPITGNTSVCRVCSSWPTETSSWKCRTHPPLTASFLPVESTQNHNRPLARLRLIVRSFIFALFPLFFTVYFRSIVIIWFSLNRSLVPVPILFDCSAYRPSCSWRRSGQRTRKRQTRCRQANERQAGNNAINLKCLISGLTHRLGLKLINIIYVRYVKIGEGG